MEIPCGVCGRVNPHNSSFCTGCGRPIGAAQPAAAGKKPAGQLNWGVFLAFGLVIIAAVVLVLISFGPQQTAPTTAVAGATQPSASSGQQIPAVPQPLPQDAAPTTEPMPKDEGCYGTNIPATLENSSATRNQYAQKANGVVSQALGSEIVYAYASGDDNKYLLYVAVSQNESALRSLSTAMLASPSIRAEICAQGFAEVQFIVKDENMHETLIENYKTDPAETIRYARQRYATPIQ